MLLKNSAPLAATLIVLALRAPASAQTVADPPRLSEDIVVTATIVPISGGSLSRSTTVFRRDQMEQLGLMSTGDALRLMPGVDARARGPLGVQTDFSIRGATFGQNLVLVDGMRINDTQSAHHNGEIPLPATAIDRIELIAGPGAAVHGADALGGTINVISRKGRYSAASLSTGQHGYTDAQGTVSGGPLPGGVMLSGWGSRSSGFEFDRDFAQGGAALRASAPRGWTLDVRHQRRAFGANGFYGNSPSKEWTDQTLAGAGWRAVRGAWTTTVDTLVRNHGDHFRWDINRPGFAENRHRTNAVDARVTTGRAINSRGSITAGLATGGDWITSSNLGDHRYTREAAFAELQYRVHDRTTVVAGLRFDRYSTFGQSTSPSLSVASRLSPTVRLRASTGHAFRIPSFTELYYSDPNNLGTPDLRAERGWSVDGGGDWTPGRWTASLSVFRRWDTDVIDWVRASAADRYRSNNVRDVTTTGFEAVLARQWGSTLLRLMYAGLTIDAPTLTLQSKYLLEYARHQSGGSLVVPLGGGLRAAINVDHRHRLDGQSYDLVGARVSRAFGRTNVFVDGTNLLAEKYHEVLGVTMPGRWLTVGVRINGGGS
ncbi:MAG: TonB-dependent receptor [Vicinamibacterales bacterium]